MGVDRFNTTLTLAGHQLLRMAYMEVYGSLRTLALWENLSPIFGGVFLGAVHHAAGPFLQEGGDCGKHGLRNVASNAPSALVPSPDQHRG